MTYATEADRELIAGAVCQCEDCCLFRRTIMNGAAEAMNRGQPPETIATNIIATFGTFLGNLLSPEGFGEVIDAAIPLVLAIAKHVADQREEAMKAPNDNGRIH